MLMMDSGDSGVIGGLTIVRRVCVVMCLMACTRHDCEASILGGICMYMPYDIRCAHKGCPVTPCHTVHAAAFSKWETMRKSAIGGIHSPTMHRISLSEQ